MAFSPNENYRYVLKQGMSGWDVWAVQIGLNGHRPSPNLIEDGIFGPRTFTAVEALQYELSITVDGIVGPQTQATLCAVESARAEVHLSPRGLLKGICYGESGGILPTTSPAYGNGARDYGAFQDNLNKPSQAQLREAFSVGLQATRIAQGLKAAHAAYFGLPGAMSHEEAWRLAVLRYNWPAAADQIAAGHGETWVYTESGTGAKRHLADRAPWIEAFQVPNVVTGWDWTKFYVQSKVTYVTSWSVT